MIVAFGGASVSSQWVGVLGASSLVGRCLLPMLVRQGRLVRAFSRLAGRQSAPGIRWQQLGKAADRQNPKIHDWISLAPIWTLPEHFDLLTSCDVQRVVALSSTSRFTKAASPDPEERAVARRLADGERCLDRWARDRRVAVVVLRPTMIYGHGQDGNISQIARVIRKFGFFAVCGAACGRRQPVHAEDVAMACLAALQAGYPDMRCYNLSGGEILTYRAMVCRVFRALGRRPVILTLPLWVFKLAAAGVHLLSAHPQWSYAMAERMNRDMVFDHSAAEADLGFCPRPFSVSGDLEKR